MGNRWTKKRDTEYINPPENPYLHIINHSDGYVYVPKVGRYLEIFLQSEKETPIKEIKIELLPPIDEVPPPYFKIQEQIDKAIRELFDEKNFIGILENTDIKSIKVYHGVVWDPDIKDAIEYKLENSGYEFDYRCLFCRRTITHYFMLLNHPKKF